MRIFLLVPVLWVAVSGCENARFQKQINELSKKVVALEKRLKVCEARRASPLIKVRQKHPNPTPKPPAIQPTPRPAALFVRYAVVYQKKRYVPKQPLLLLPTKDMQAKAVLPFPIEKLAAAKVTLTLSNKTGRSVSQKAGPGHKTLLLQYHSQSLSLQLRYKKGACHQVQVIEKLAQVKALFKALNNVIASDGSLKDLCQQKIYDGLVNGHLNKILKGDPAGTIRFFRYSPQVELLFQVSASPQK